MSGLLELANDPNARLQRVPILLPVALDQTYDYIVPPGMQLAPGEFVHVPFGPQHRLGIVWDKPIGPEKPIAESKLKPVIQPIDVPRLPELTLRFAEWIARYSLAPIGMVARMMMSAKTAFEPVKPRFGVAIVPEAVEPPRMTPAREKVLAMARDGNIRTKAALAQAAGCSSGVVDGLVTSGNLVECAIPEKVFPKPNPDHVTVEFSDAQQVAVHSLRAQASSRNFAVTLLDGVTGSGKTEVYYEAVAAALASGRQVVIMLPEIALTSQFMRRFEARFGCPPVEWHSALGAPERGRVWKAAASGEARCIVGARSALFLPYADLGLIVVDEEHDGGFKQEDRVHYQARDMAIVRANLGQHAVVLASATPSIESHVNARNGRYAHAVLPGRFSGVEMPEIKAIDMRSNPADKGKWLSPLLVDAVNETLAKDQQTLLFLNRRGYAPLTLCQKCGHRIECPQCSAWLVEHRFRKQLNCHHCGFHLPTPEACPKCEEPGSMVACGPGVERVSEEVAERWPDARVAILSSDLIPGLVEMRQVIKSIENGEADIIIGTQLVAKGHHFPDLATVGIVDGDLGLGQADPRAGERTFQLLHQVTGRAGREQVRGRGLIQTHLPDHPVMDAIISGDREAFLEREIQMRQAAMLPPYGRLAALIVSSKSKELSEAFAKEVARRAPYAERISVLGPAEAPLAVIRGQHRWRLLVKAPRDLDLQGYLRTWMDELPQMKGDLRLVLDVDPYSFL